MRSTILYFSGTGNTYYIASLIKEMRSDIETITMIPFEKYSKSVIESSKRIYIGFPVYALDSISVFKDILSHDLVNKEVYLFCTMAYSEGNALINAKKLVKKSKGIVIGCRSIIMPGSDGMSFMKPESKMVKKMLDRDFSKIPEMDLINKDLKELDNLVSRNINKYNNKYGFVKYIFFYFISKIIKPLESLMSKRLNAGVECNGCGYCQKICPVKNITVDSNIVEFGNNCILCMRCVSLCPKKTINIGNLTKGKYRYSGPGKLRFKPLLQ